MGRVFSNMGTDKQRYTPERKNVRRILFVALFMAILAICGVVYFHKLSPDTGSDKLSVALALYAVLSVAFSCFAFQLLKRKSKRSELWLFQMSYMIANTSFLTFISFLFRESFGSLAVYCLFVVLNSCSLLYSKGEYALCFGIECVLPAVLLWEHAPVPQEMILLGAAHLLGVVIAAELGRYNKVAEEYRRKYIQEVKAAEMDPLTKANNRRGMMRRVMSVWPALEEAKRAVAVMVIDIDHFKKYNDKFGHPAGDACLSRVAATVQQTVKGVPALVARIGGEEFLVFLHGIGEEGAYNLAEQIRKNVEEMAMPHAEDARYRYVTVSIGVAADRCSAEISFGGLYRRADKELYRAKNSGRNRVVCQNNDFSTERERRIGMY